MKRGTRSLAMSSRWSRLGIAALVTLTTPGLASATCSPSGASFGQLLPNCGGDYCYVVSPGQHTSETLAGTFWSFGTGKPELGQGDDNGAWPVGDWLLPSGSSRFLAGFWDASSAIDGCITGRVAPGRWYEIMIATISDELVGGAASEGFFAVASARRVANEYPEFDFTFVAGGGLPRDIDLVAIPRAWIVSFTHPDTYQFRGPSLPDVSPGIYGDLSLAPEEVVKGYRIYMTSGDVSSLRTSAGWAAISGIVPLGQNSSLQVPCPASGRIHFGYALVFEGGFETAHVGRPMGALCRYCADRDGDGFADLFGDPECCLVDEACDCNDLDPNVHPGAVEVCNGVDDDCDYVIDDVSLPGSVASLQLDKQPGTTLLDWPALAVATSYDVVRGDISTLLAGGGSYADATRTCLADDLTVNHADEPIDPGPDSGFWYLIRAANCIGVGSYDAPDPSQFAPRDAGIAASVHACP